MRAFVPIITADWKASNGNTWTVPLGGGFGRVMKLGFQPVNVTAQFYGKVVRLPGPIGSLSRVTDLVVPIV